MLRGVYLTLLIGPAVPVIAPPSVIEALTGVEVTNSKELSGFQLTFTLGKNSPLLTHMLPAGYFDPIITRVIIIATLLGTPHVLMDGLVTKQQLTASNEPGKSTLTITGEDLSLAMNVIKRIMPCLTEKTGTIYTILAPYSFLGIVPLIVPPIIPIINYVSKGWKTQTNTTDREYLKTLASECGYIFFVQPGPLPFQSIAYFGPDFNLPVPQPALSINLDANSNVEALSFTLNGLAKKIRIFTIFDPVTKKIPLVIPVPNINALKPPMGARINPPSQIEFETEAGSLWLDEAAEKILGFMMNNPPSVTVKGSMDILRYKGLLRAGMMVGVRGAGVTYDGLYFVDSVTHNIKHGEYKQNFTLSRDGLISNTSSLPIN